MHLTLIHAVDLDGIGQRCNGHSDPMAQLAIQRIIAAEHSDIVLLKKAPHLEIWLAHLQTERLGLCRSGHNRTVTVAQDNNGPSSQLRPENALA